MHRNRSIPNREGSAAARAQTGDVDSSASPADSWHEHEHVASPLQIQAQRLLAEAGSPELAKHAVDLAGQAPPAGSPQDQFARQLEFASYLSLFEDSSLCAADEGRQWFATAIRNGEWILWNDADLVIAGTYPTREAAERAAPSSASGQVS